MQRSLSNSGVLKERFKIELPRNNRVGVYNLLYSSHHLTNRVENAFCGNISPCFKSTEETFSHPLWKWYARLHVFEKCWLTVFFTIVTVSILGFFPFDSLVKGHVNCRKMIRSSYAMHTMSSHWTFWNEFTTTQRSHTLLNQHVWMYCPARNETD